MPLVLFIYIVGEFPTRTQPVKFDPPILIVAFVSIIPVMASFSAATLALSVTDLLVAMPETSAFAGILRRYSAAETVAATNSVG